ncbi:hypothetical protein [Aeromicrobium sp. 179-A 4D2 NHS]|uniref:hypothetical protein n=1 Tax=Aeromicrobium sp. 179-A 4D2 NHS TaxID=3142375 RepID=UPI0039A29E6C
MNAFNPLLHPRGDYGEFTEKQLPEAVKPLEATGPATCGRCTDPACSGWRCSPSFHPDIPVDENDEPAYRCGGCGEPLFNADAMTCGKTECHPGFDADYEAHMQHEMWLQENAGWFRDHEF